MMPAPFRRTFNLLCWEAAFAMAYDTWVGNTYLSGLAGELQIPILLLSFLTALPWIGSVGQVLGTWALHSFKSLKVYTLILASISRALWIVPLAAAAWWRIQTRNAPGQFPVQKW